jgi:hypothetical protein
MRGEQGRAQQVPVGRKYHRRSGACPTGARAKSLDRGVVDDRDHQGCRTTSSRIGGRDGDSRFLAHVAATQSGPIPVQLPYTRQPVLSTPIQAAYVEMVVTGNPELTPNATPAGEEAATRRLAQVMASKPTGRFQGHRKPARPGRAFLGPE